LARFGFSSPPHRSVKMIRFWGASARQSSTRLNRGVLVYLCALKFIEYFTPLLYIGRNALAIFCLHVLFVAGARIVLVKIFGVSDVSLILPAAILAGVAGPLAFVQIVERFRLRAALGLGPN
jgi:hypothetical protein